VSFKILGGKANGLSIRNGESNIHLSLSMSDNQADIFNPEVYAPVIDGQVNYRNIKALRER